MPDLRVQLCGRPGADGGLFARLSARLGALPGVRVAAHVAPRAPASRASRLARRLAGETAAPSPGARDVAADVGGAVDLVVNCGGLRLAAPATARFGALAFEADFAEGLALWRAGRGEGGAIALALLHAEPGRQDWRTVDDATAPAKPSLQVSLELLRGVAEHLLVRAVRQLAEEGRLPETAAAPSATTAAPKGLAALATFAVRAAAAGAGRARDIVEVDLRWRLGRLAPRFELFFGDGDPVVADFERSLRAPGPAGSYLADPFLIERDGTLHVFFERYDLAAGRGAIGVARIDGGRFVFLGDALAPEHHVSYPFVFAHQGAVYMIPETVATRRVEIWRAADFPLRWTLAATAFEGVAAVDTTLLEHDGVWWVFVNRAEGGAADGTTLLELYRADGPLLTTLTPHRRNPVVIDARSARNGGRPFRRGGRLYRPAQHNAASVYGYALNIMEIEALDDRQYRERLVRTVVGSHHLDIAGDRFIFDVRRDGGRERFGKLGVLAHGA